MVDIPNYNVNDPSLAAACWKFAFPLLLGSPKLHQRHSTRHTEDGNANSQMTTPTSTYSITLNG